MLIVHALKATNPNLSLRESTVMARSIVRFLKSHGYEIVKKARAVDEQSV
jgi:hypothetical protein